MSHAALDGPRLAAVSGVTRSLVIFLHGYGSNGSDLIEIGKQWSPDFPHTAFVGVHAPEPCPMAPGGRQWFALSHNPGGMRRPDEYWEGVCHSEAVLHGFIESELRRHGLDESRCVLVGFSQGTMMALHVGMRRERVLAGIIAYSGVLAGPEKLQSTLKSKPPVLLVHGADDPVIPVGALYLARAALQEVEIEPEWHIAADLGHGVDSLGLMLGHNFLRRVL